jgi:hypothetical protein
VVFINFSFYYGSIIEQKNIEQQKFKIIKLEYAAPIALSIIYQVEGIGPNSMLN